MAVRTNGDRFDEIVTGLTNEEVLEFALRIHDEMADRAERVLELAEEVDDRDMVNEAYAFASVADGMLNWAGGERTKRCAFRIQHACDALQAIVQDRALSSVKKKAGERNV